MPRFSEMFEQVLDYNLGWGWRCALDLYYRLKGTR